MTATADDATAQHPAGSPNEVDAPAHSWLAVQAGGQALLLPLADCGEIHHGVALGPVPHTVRWFAGVAALRGEVHAVTDLGAWLGVSEPIALSQHAPLVALHPRLGLGAALRVGKLLGLRTSNQLEPQPEAPCPAFAQSVWLDGEGQTWYALDASRWLKDPAFLDIAAMPQTA